MRNLRRLLAAVIAGIFLLLPGVAYAVPPVDISRNYEDYADVSEREAQLSNLIVEVSSGNLWVITVDNFDGLAPDNWAQKTFDKSGLTSVDGLLAVSVGTSELYAYSPDGQIKELLNQATSQDVLDKFHDGEWDAGIELFGEHVRTLRNGGPAPVAPGQAAVPNVLPVIVLIALGGAVVVGFSVWRKKKARVSEDMSNAQLAKQASAELLAADDDVRAGANELEFARAEFGVEATREFHDALTQAQEAVHKAFNLRRLLDDDEPETPAQQHQMNTQILQLSHHARETMQAQAEQFSALRDLANRVDSKLSDLQERHDELQAQLSLAEVKVRNLGLSFPQESLATISTYPSQIRTLLSASSTHIIDAHTHVKQAEKGEAVQYARMAEGVLDQASKLIDRIDQAPTLLAQARDHLPQAIESLSADISDAKRLGQGNATITQRRQEAEAAIARATAGSAVDLLLVADQLEEAERQLDLALVHVRTAAEQEDKRNTKLTQYRIRLEEKLARLDEDVTRYREVVTADTRTLLNRAHSAFTSAQSQTGEQQLSTYSSAMDYAQRAERALNSDIEDYRGSGRQSRTGSELGGELAGAILTGVARSLIYGALSGGSSRRNDWGNNSFGSGGNSHSGGGFGSGGGGFGKTF
ncbi:TPM domain-containing protein [Arcanobacterium phocae]|uniref:TPM domain-containing protein n=1 Tax=Arcanobacterium phocae TaxID=131112 RepID=UPI001C0EA928|nr:TPM domain-containing protein [Arcanobacterium phocae]